MPSLDELRLIVSQRNTSPRGVVADSNFFDSSSSNNQSSNAKNVPSQADIDTYTSKFIQDVMKIGLTYTEYRGAMTIVPSGKSVLVLFCCVNSCVQYEVLVI